jgi:hypothetical protein
MSIDERECARGHLGTRQAACTARVRGAESLVSVYLDMSASAAAVHTAVTQIDLPEGVSSVRVDDRSMTDTFGCRIAIDLTGTFRPATEGLTLARWYAEEISRLVGVPAHALYDLLRSDPTEFNY